MAETKKETKKQVEDVSLGKTDYLLKQVDIGSCLFALGLVAFVALFCVAYMQIKYPDEKCTMSFDVTATNPPNPYNFLASSELAKYNGMNITGHMNVEMLCRDIEAKLGAVPYN